MSEESNPADALRRCYVDGLLPKDVVTFETLIGEMKHLTR